MKNDLTLNKVLAFFRAFKGDEIVFNTQHCGTYTDVYSEIYDVEISTLRVKVHKNYNNADCVDQNNLTNVSIDSIVNILYHNSPIEVYKIDGKILSLQAFIKKNNTRFTHFEQQTLEKLLKRFELFYSEILFEKSKPDSVDEKINRKRFDSLFIDL